MTLSKHIKSFVEENINYIEKQDWKTTFFSYYLHWGNIDVKTDYKYMQELFDVLRVVDPDVVEDSFDVRAEIIQDQMEYSIYARLNHPIDTEPLHFKSLIYTLTSRLGFDESDLYAIFVNAAENCGVEIKLPQKAIYFEE